MSIKNSFSLIEVLIFVTILSLFLIVAAAIITASMRQNTLKIHMLKATHYNEQLLDWIRNEKEINWSDFVAHAQNNTYCFNSDSFTWISNCNSTLGDVYKRYAVFATTVSDDGVPTQVAVAIHTDWQEAGNTYTNKLDSLFTVWEQ